MQLQADLSGDGRKTVEPDPETDYYGNPIETSLGGARSIIHNFLSNGGRSEGHSRLGQTIWVEQEFCEKNNLDYSPVTVEFEGEEIVIGLETKENVTEEDLDVVLD